MNQIELLCACGIASHAKMNGNVPVMTSLTNYEIAQWPSIDPKNPMHFIFGDISMIVDANDGVWHDFNGGAEPICPECWTIQITENIMRAHAIDTCTYGDCAEMRSLSNKK